MRRILIIAFLLSAMTIVINSADAGFFGLGDYEKDSLATDKAKGEQLVKKLNTTEVMAPLAPIALSPFFGITCLSGTSILCDKGVLPENEFLMGNPALNNGMVFIVFLALSVATSLPKMTTVSKGFAEAADQLETYAGIISYAAILYFSGFGQESVPENVVYTAGIFTFSKTTLVMIAASINIIVINTVKYFFELLVWISPIPLLDAAFETANKVVTAVLVTIYAFSPYLAMLLNAILFLVCLSIFNWVRRRIIYFRVVFLGPIVAKLFGRERVWIPKRTRAKVADITEQGEILVKVFAARKIRKIKKKEMCYLAAAKDGLFLVKLRLIRKSKVEKLATANVQLAVMSGLLSNSIEIASNELKKPAILVFSKVYNNQMDSIAMALGAFGKVERNTDSGNQSESSVSPQPA